MIIVVSDHAGYELKEELLGSGFLEKFDSEIEDINPVFDLNDDYPDKVASVFPLLKEHPSATIIALCGSGQGICMALNKLPLVRAGFGYSMGAAEIMRIDNNANGICFAARDQRIEQLKEILQAFYSTDFSDQERHQRRVDKLDKLHDIDDK